MRWRFPGRSRRFRRVINPSKWICFEDFDQFELSSYGSLTRPTQTSAPHLHNSFTTVVFIKGKQVALCPDIEQNMSHFGPNDAQEE